MIKRSFRTWAWLFCLALVATDLIGQGIATSDAAQEVQSQKLISPSAIHAQVQAIAQSHTLSRAKKEKKIAATIRVAIAAATAYQKNSAASLNIAVDLAIAAAQAAPQFTRVIIDAASFTPTIARIDGASSQIEAAINAGTKPRRTTQPSSTAVTKNMPADTSAMAERTNERAYARRPEQPLLLPENAVGDSATTPQVPQKWTIPEIDVGDNASVHLTATVNTKYDNNIFLTKDNTVSDEIIAFTPGAEFRFGQKSLTHGSLVAQEAFTHYNHGSAPSAQLASCSADFGFGNDNLSIATAGSFHEIYQNSSDAAALGQHTLFRSNTTSANGVAADRLWALTSVDGGINYSHDHFKNPGLTDNNSLAFPFHIYHSITPKVDLFSGVTYQVSKVDGSPQKAKDYYYNLGARGDFTPKLSGQFSAGYKTRTLGLDRNDSTLGFDSSLSYALTPKTSCSLEAARGFSTSALGESLTNTRYTLNLTTNFSPQWQGSASISHSNIHYGAAYNPASGNPDAQRIDKYWQGNVQATYLYTNWLSVTAGATFRENHSTLNEAEFSNILLNLLFGLKY